jgi:hypothetical protein
MLNALDCSNRIHRIQLRGVHGPSAHEHVRSALVVLKQAEAAWFALAENLEAPKDTPRL